MQVVCFKAHTVSECGCCGLVLVVDNGPEGTMGDISEAYHKHLHDYPMCQRWHDNLPTLADVQRAWRESTGNE